MIATKFGGTSLEDAKAIARCCEIVQSRLDRQPVVVASAMAGVTDALLQASALASDGDEQRTIELIGDLELRHQATACELLDGPGAVLADMAALIAELRPLLLAVCALAN